MAAAGRALDLSASAVAKQLHALERDLDTQLIVRVGRTVRITEQGDLILSRARRLLKGFADLRSAVHDGAVRGEIKLGACSTALIGDVPGILSKLGLTYPDITVRIESNNSVQLYADVEAGKLDAAFVLEAPHPLPKTCDWQLLREEPLVVLAPARWALRDPHDLLRSEPFIRYDRTRWGGRGADDYLAEQGIVVRERIELDLLQAIAVMVDVGLGISLVPDWAKPWPEDLSVARVQLPERRIGRRMGIVWSRSTVRARLVQALLEECRRSMALRP